MNKQSGSMAFIAMAAVSALALSAFYVQNLSSQAHNKVKEIEKNMLVESAKTNNISNLSVIRGLLEPTKVQPNLYEPAIYAENYFADTWKIKPNELLPSPAFSTSLDKIKIKSFSTRNQDIAGAKKFFDGSRTQLEALTEAKELKILRINRDSFHYYFISSVDVIAKNKVLKPDGTEGTQEIESIGRIHLKAPEPGPAKIEISVAGSNVWTTNFGTAAVPLAAGKYRLRILASGVVHHGEVTQSNGATMILGLKGDEIDHHANNIHATDELIGETIDIQLGEDRVETQTVNNTATVTTGAASSGTVTRAGCYYSIGAASSTPAAPSGSGSSTSSSSTSTTTASVAVPIDLTVKIFGVDGSQSTESQIQKVFISSTVTTNVVTNTTTTATAGTAPASSGGSCREMCGRDRQSMNNDEYFDFLDASGLGIGGPRVLDLYRPEESAGLPAPGGAICGNLEHVGQNVAQELGYSRVKDIRITNTKWNEYSALIGDGGPAMEFERLFGYVAPACVRQLIGYRDGCGCFQEDTLIRMADGSERKASEIRQGDQLWNPKTQRSQAVKRVIAGPEAKPLYALRMGDKLIRVTSEHPFLTRQGLKPAEALKVGDLILEGTGEERLEAIELESPALGESNPVVWNFELEGSSNPDDHYVLANGVMTGDLYLQIELKKASKDIKSDAE